MSIELKKEPYIQIRRISDLINDKFVEFELKQKSFIEKFKADIDEILLLEDNFKFTCFECYEVFDKQDELIEHHIENHYECESCMRRVELLDEPRQ